MDDLRFIVEQFGDDVAVGDIKAEYDAWDKAGQVCPECGRKIAFDEWYLLGACIPCAHKAGDC